MHRHNAPVFGQFHWHLFAILILVLLTAKSAIAAPVSAENAAKAVRGWLRQDHRPLGKILPPNIKRTRAVKNSSGATSYYVVELSPAGYVILSADDLTDPVVAFSAKGNFDPASGSTMAALVNHDLPRHATRAKSRGKWSAFLAEADNPPPDVEENGSIVTPSRVWVAPFVQTLWGQTVDASLNDACYNYYTPQGTNVNTTGNVSNYPCGCVATALAEEMYYFQYPNTGVGVPHFFNVTNDTHGETLELLGGDLNGGPYAWANMPLNPNNPSDTQARAIGALTHDAGLAVNMTYTPSLSSAFTYLAQKALTNTFKYSSASYFEDDAHGLSGSNLNSMINPNLDARLPVILGIEPSDGHCLLVDGYGYSAGTLFHHLNTGFNGDDDIWYALPQIMTSDGNGNFDTVVACIYNIYTNGSGQILSGHVTDPSGAAVSGATITAVRSGGSTLTTTTDSNGVYAFARIPASSTYTVTAAKAESSSANGAFSTGKSVYNVLPSGNVWGADFVLTQDMSITPSAGFNAVGRIGGPFTVTRQIYTLSNATSSSISWDLTNTPHMTIAPNHGTIAAGSASNIIISLTGGGTNFSAGTSGDYVLITNLNSGVVFRLDFTNSVTAGDYPVPLSGFNRDVIVEAEAVGGSTINYADVFDPNYPLLDPPGPVCFYARGLMGTDLVGNGPITLGLPENGQIFSPIGSVAFQLAPYENSNVLYLTHSLPSETLTLPSPAAYKSLTILAASALGTGSGSFVIHFADGTVSSNLTFLASNYLNTNSAGANAAFSGFGEIATGSLNVFSALDGSTLTALYQSSVDLHAGGLDAKLISSITFTLPPVNSDQFTADSVTGVFAVSGSLAPFSGNYPLALSAEPALGGNVTGAGAFALGDTNTVTATSNPGYDFESWTYNGAVVSTSPEYTFLINGGETLVAHFVPADLLVTVGGPLSITVLINGSGTVTPNWNGKPVKTNHVYTLTATPGPTNVFSNWTGSIVTNKNPLTFTLKSSVVLQANFVTNPFLALKGRYNGLFSPSSGVTEQTSGMLKNLVVGTKGTYSGALLINGASHSLSGAFNLGGQAAKVIPRPAAQGGPLAVNLSLAGSPPQLTGTISGSNNGAGWRGNLVADLAAKPAHTTEYTMLIPLDSTNAPGGYGYALITNSAANAKVTGALADGTAFAETVPVSQDGYVPLYANLYAHKGLLLGWINLGLTNTNAVSLTWIRPPGKPTMPYPAGFTNNLPASQVLLSPWSNAPATLGLLSNLTLIDRIGDTNAIASFSVTNTNGKLTGAGLTGTINLKTGLLKIVAGTGAHRTNGTGAILLNATNGGGYFLAKTNAQALQFN